MKKVLAKWDEDGLWYPGYVLPGKKGTVQYLDGELQTETQAEGIWSLPKTWDWEHLPASSEKGLVLLNQMVVSQVQLYKTQGRDASWDLYTNGLVPVRDFLEKPVLTWDEFFERYIWVVYCSGFRVALVDKKWDWIKQDWLGFDIDKVERRGPVSKAVLRDFSIKNESKTEAIYETSKALKRYRSRIPNIRSHLEEMAGSGELEEWLRRFGFIGEVTVNHLMRNLGIDVFKPDRHVCRVGRRIGLYGRAKESDFSYVQNAWLLAIGEPNQNDKLDIRRPAFADVVIWAFGKDICSDTPKCSLCMLTSCKSRDRRPSGSFR